MCGISGIISKNQISSNDEAQVTQMTELLLHRGPDGSGFFKDDRVILGMRRLSIIDTGGSNQPLWNRDKSITLIFNGEIYNYIELQKDLQAKGYVFSTQGDGETIIHAYEEYGTDFLNYLRGMFAFCLYDLKNQKVIIARDRLGEKPLYIYEDQHKIAFSSEMKSVVTMLHENDRHLDLDALNLYFHYQYIPEPLTPIKRVRKLSAGNTLTIDLKTFNKEEKSYWDPRDITPLDLNPIETTRGILNDIEKIIIRSDVPVGISLSGGLDSSIIACLSAKYSNKKLHAFSVGYPGRPDNDERNQAQKLAQSLGLIFHEVEIDPKTVADGFEQMVYNLDDPIADIASYGYLAIAQRARKENVPVLLSGLGSDELFWGYDWMIKSAQINNLKNKGFIHKFRVAYILAKHWRKELHKDLLKGLVTLLQKSFSSDYVFYELTPGFFSTEQNKKYIFTAEFLSKINDDKLLKFRKMPSSSPDIDLCLLLQKYWLLSNCLPIGDRLSMSSSVELRMPFLDYKIFEAVFGMRMQNSDSKLGPKYWLKKAVVDLVPQEIISREKRGFTPPTLSWITEIVKRNKNHLTDGLLVRSGIIRKSFVEAALGNIKQNREFLYKLSVIEVWLSKFKVQV